jgi:cysteine sulfinate desulfinase/cysteine desulfurase-like protein
MGISEADAQSSLRFTLGHATDQPAIDRTAEVLASFL